MLKNILVRTYLVGNTCQNRTKITKPSLMRAYVSINSLLKATGINLMNMIDESKHYLTLTDRIQIIAPGQIGARDEEGSQQLQHVDMLFRLYLPLYSLLKQTG